MEGAIRVNTLVEETTEATILLHDSVTRTAMLRRKKSMARLAERTAA
jgi:hypothetical protein